MSELCVPVFTLMALSRLQILFFSIVDEFEGLGCIIIFISVTLSECKENY